MRDGSRGGKVAHDASWSSTAAGRGLLARCCLIAMRGKGAEAISFSWRCCENKKREREFIEADEFISRLNDRVNGSADRDIEPACPAHIYVHRGEWMLTSFLFLL